MLLHFQWRLKSEKYTKHRQFKMNLFSCHFWVHSWIFWFNSHRTSQIERLVTQTHSNHYQIRKTVLLRVVAWTRFDCLHVCSFVGLFLHCLFSAWLFVLLPDIWQPRWKNNAFPCLHLHCFLKSCIHMLIPFRVEWFKIFPSITATIMTPFRPDL